MFKKCTHKNVAKYIKLYVRSFVCALMQRCERVCVSLLKVNSVCAQRYINSYPLFLTFKLEDILVVMFLFYFKAITYQYMQNKRH